MKRVIKYKTRLKESFGILGLGILSILIGLLLLPIVILHAIISIFVNDRKYIDMMRKINKLIH